MNTTGDAGWVPRLATRWEWAPDSLSITFHLDPKATWHDGAPVADRDKIIMLFHGRISGRRMRAVDEEG